MGASACLRTAQANRYGFRPLLRCGYFQSSDGKVCQAGSGIELVQESIAAAVENAQRNQISNSHFFCGDVSELVKTQLKNQKFDTVIVDPPRTGLAETVIQAIAQLQVKKLIYISCEPATQARDLAVFLENYALCDVQPLDMFPDTAHIETIAYLTRK